MIRSLDSYDNIIVTDVNQVRVSDFNKDIMSVSEFFVNYTEENMKSNDYDSYRKYIFNIFKKNPTIGHVIQLLNKLGYGSDLINMLQNILSTNVEKTTLDIYNFRPDMVMQQCIHNKKYNITKFISLFKK